MLEARKLTICGLEYTVMLAGADEVPELAANEGYTVPERNLIYIRSNVNPSRARDILVHEIGHAFFEATGLGHFLQDNFRGDDFDKFEETFIRLAVPHVLRLVDDNGGALTATPKPGIVKIDADARGRAKRGR